MTKHLTSSSLVIILVATILMILLLKQGYYGYTPFTHNNQVVNSFMLNTHVTTYNTLGNLKNKLQSLQIEHIQANDTTIFLQPRILLYTSNPSPWHIRANNGRSEHGNQVIQLWDNVIIHREKSQVSPYTTIKTNQLTYFPNKNYAISHQLTTIIRPGSIASGIGSIVNFKTGVVTLLAHSRGTYESNN